MPIDQQSKISSHEYREQHRALNNEKENSLIKFFFATVAYTLTLPFVQAKSIALGAAIGGAVGGPLGAAIGGVAGFIAGSLVYWAGYSELFVKPFIAKDADITQKQMDLAVAYDRQTRPTAMPAQSARPLDLRLAA